MSRSLAAARPLRVAYVTGSLGLGGSERQMLLLAAHLPRDRFEVEFVLLGRPGELADEARTFGARVLALNGPSRASARFPIWAARVIAAVWAFVRLVRRRRYDVIDAWLFGSYALAAVTRPLTRIPVLVAGRRSLSDYKAHFWTMQRVADRLTRNWSDAIVANADAVAEDVSRREGLPADRIRVIRNAVEILPAPDADEIGRLRHAWGANRESVVIGSVANYKPGKGIHMLLEAFAEIANARPKTHLVLVGEGPLRAALEERVGELGLQRQVSLVGAVRDPRRIYHAFDIAVLASETEGLPNVLLEAAAAARPLVATDAGGSREIVIDGETGLLTPVDDRAAMAHALLTLVDAPDRRSAFGAAAQRRAASEFSVERSVAAFTALYEELCAAKATGPR